MNFTLVDVYSNTGAIDLVFDVRKGASKSEGDCNLYKTYE